MLLPVGPALFCALVITCAAQDEEEMPDERGPCDSPLFAKVDACCDTPQLLPVELLKSCITEMGRPDHGQQQPDIQAPEVYNTQEMPTFASGAGGPMTVIECMFKKQNLLSTSGQIDVPAIDAKFTTVAGSVWQPVVTQAIVNCSTELAKLKMDRLEESSLGNLAPALFMTCLRRNLTLSCPEGSVRDPDSSCVATFSVLRQCGPFSLGSGPQGGGGGWFGGVLRWMAGPQHWGQKRGPGKQGAKGFFFPIFRMIFPFG